MRSVRVPRPGPTSAGAALLLPLDDDIHSCQVKLVNCQRTFAMIQTAQIVALLFGLIPAGDQTLPVSIQFKTITACNAARVAIEAKHAGAKLSCLDNAVYTNGASSDWYFPTAAK